MQTHILDFILFIYLFTYNNCICFFQNKIEKHLSYEKGKKLSLHHCI